MTKKHVAEKSFVVLDSKRAAERKGAAAAVDSKPDQMIQAKLKSDTSDKPMTQMYESESQHVDPDHYHCRLIRSLENEGVKTLKDKDMEVMQKIEHGSSGAMSMIAYMELGEIQREYITTYNLRLLN